MTHRTLERLQWVLVWLIAFSCVIASPRLELVSILVQTNVPLDFRSVTLSIPDFFLIALVFVGALRMIGSAEYRQSFFSTLDGVMIRCGGLIWVLLIAWMGISLLWSASPVMTRYDTLHAALCLLLAVFLADLMRTRSKVYGILLALMAGAALQSIIAGFQVLNNGPLGLSWLGEVPRFPYDPTNFFRATGLSMHANYLGGYLMIGLFACLLTAFLDWRAQRSVTLPLLLALLSVVGLIATLSRSAILGATVALVLTGLTLFRALPNQIRTLLIGAAGALVIGAAVWGIVVLRGDLATRLLSTREFFLADSWAQIQATPLRGSGTGSLMIEIAARRGYGAENLLPVHNAYLFVWAELGLIGMLLFLAGCVLSLFIWFRQARNRQLFIWGCCFLGMCVIMLFDNYFWAVHPFRVLLFLVLGQAWGLTAISRSAQKPQSAGESNAAATLAVRETSETS